MKPIETPGSSQPSSTRATSAMLPADSGWRSPCCPKFCSDWKPNSGSGCSTGIPGVLRSPTGAALLPHAHSLLQAEQDLRETAQAQGSGDARVRLGVDPRLPIGLSAVLAEVCSAATSVVRITVHTAPTNSVLEAVAVGRFQLGVVVHPAGLGVVDGDRSSACLPACPAAAPSTSTTSLRGSSSQSDH